MIRGDKLIVLILYIIISTLIITSVFAIEETPDSNVNTQTTDTDVSSGIPSSPITNLPQSESQTDIISQKAANWLEENTAEQSGIFDQSLSVIAMVSAGKTDVSKYVKNIKDAQDSEAGCWPKTKCKVKDTSLATIAMYVTGQTEEMQKGIEWLKTAGSVNPAIGEWWIVIKSISGEGECSISWEGLNQPKSYTLEGDMIKESPGKYYINVANLNPSLLRKLMPILTVDCSSDSIIALIYKPASDKFFIQESESTSSIDIKMSNLCYGESISSRCDFESTAYATWALLETDSRVLEDIGTSIYLRSKVKQNDVLELSLLNRVLYKSGSLGQSFVNELSNLQRPDGSWGTKIFNTALASLSLNGNSEQSETVAHSLSYLQKKQEEDGSWKKNVQETSMALIALNGPDLHLGNVGLPPESSNRNSGVTEDCTNDIDDDLDGFNDCGDSDCITYLSSLCSNGKKDRCEENRDCGPICGACEDSSFIEPEDECQTNSECSADEICRNGQCVYNTQSIPPDTTPQEDPNGFPWLWTIIVFLFILGLIFFYIKYIKTGKIDLKSLFKRKSKSQNFEDFKRQTEFKQQPYTQPRQLQKSQQQTRSPIRPPIKPQIKSREELELDKSIKEAQKIIKGK